MRQGSVLLLAPTLVLAACTRSAKHEVATVTPITLAVLTGLSGTTEPCGCTSQPLGGLDKIAARIEALAKSEPAFATLVSGSTFVADADPPAHLFAQERDKAALVAKLLARWQPLAILRGPFDLGVYERRIAKLGKQDGLPLLRPARAGQTHSGVDSVVRTLGGVKLGVLGSAAEISDPAEYTVGAAALRAQGAKLVIALVPESGKDAQVLAQKLDRIDIIIAGGDDELLPPRVVNEALVLEAGNKGRYLGLLRIHPSAKGGPWMYNDEGKAKRHSLEARIERLRKELAALADGPAKEARASKLAELEVELREVSARAPEGSYVTWATEPVAQDLPAAPWASALLAAYNASLCEVAKEATATRTCEAATSPADSFAGNDSCRECHSDAFAVWQKSKHAHAWSTLTAKGKQCDLGCISCHTVGFEVAGGYCRLQDAEAHANVGCESCHGPSLAHVQNPDDKKAWSAHFTRAKDAKVCAHCHTPEHSDTFNFDTYLPKILGPGHGEPLVPKQAD